MSSDALQTDRRCGSGAQENRDNQDSSPFVWRGLRAQPDLFCRINGFAAVSLARLGEQQMAIEANAGINGFAAVSLARRRSGSPASVRRSVRRHLSLRGNPGLLWVNDLRQLHMFAFEASAF